MVSRDSRSARTGPMLRLTALVAAVVVTGAVLYAAWTAISLLLGAVSSGEPPVGDPAASWEEAAARQDFALYRPTWLPPDVGELQLNTLEIGGMIRAVDAEYRGGLVINQSTQVAESGGPVEPARIAGADEARYESPEDQRILVIRRGRTWISLFGRPDKQLVRVAESLRPVRKEED